jgi:hypothetical protein
MTYFVYGARGEDDLNPATCAMRFQTKIMQKYGPTLPRIFIGSFEEAIDQAKQNFKFLLVYLHCDIHQSTPRFCRFCLITLFFSTNSNEKNEKNKRMRLCGKEKRHVL